MSSDSPEQVDPQMSERDQPMLRSRCHNNYGNSSVRKKTNAPDTRESLQQDPQRGRKPPTAYQCLHPHHVDRRHRYAKEGPRSYEREITINRQ